MKNRIFILLCGLLSSLAVLADTLVLHSGKRVSGEILIENEQVVILRDENGARHQYPASEVLRVERAEAAAEVQTEVAQPSSISEQTSTQKRTTLMPEIGGGVAFLPHDAIGGWLSADVLIGSRQIAGRPMVIGGSVGYLGAFMGGERYNVLPIQVTLRMPMLQEGKHTPIWGANIGYGIGLSKSYRGGLHAGFEVGYGYRMSGGKVVKISAVMRFQQVTIPTEVVIDEFAYTGMAGRNLLMVGLSVGVGL